MPRSLWDPSSPTRDRPGALSSESAESQSPDCQGTPQGGKEGFPRRRWRHRRDPRAEKEPSVAENEGAAAGKTLWSGGMGGLAQRAEDSSHELPADTFLTSFHRRWGSLCGSLSRNRPDQSSMLFVRTKVFSQVAETRPQRLNQIGFFIFDLFCFVFSQTMESGSRQSKSSL